jgi:hypothetical protein
MQRMTSIIATSTLGFAALTAAAQASQGPGAGPGTGNSIVLTAGAIVLAAMLALIGWHRYKPAADHAADAPHSPRS